MQASLHRISAPTMSGSRSMSQRIRIPTARQACVRCRTQKRKCSRQLPTCEQCGKYKRRCEYPADAISDIWSPDKNDTPPPVSIVGQGLVNHQQRSSYALRRHTDFLTKGNRQRLYDNSFPSLFFLDTWLFGKRNGSIAMSRLQLPSEFLEAAGLEPQVFAADLELYFRETHHYFPIGTHIIKTTR